MVVEVPNEVGVPFLSVTVGVATAGAGDEFAPEKVRVLSPV